jgi:integrase
MPDGYEVRGKSVRVYFRYEGQLCREPIGNATPENIKRAERLAKIINLEIESGIFDYARHFPDSDRVRGGTFGHYASL